jgi:guanine deaminase
VSNDEEFMREAIRLAREGCRAGKGGPFGAVVVRGGEIVGRGCNRVLATSDPTAHAEVVAIREAAGTLESFHLDGCRLYTSCEPCPMCLGAIYWARLDRVYFANTRADAAGIGFQDDFLYEEIGLPLALRRIPMLPVLRDEAIRVFEEWSASEGKRLY